MMADRCLRALGMRQRTELHINTLGDAERFVPSADVMILISALCSRLRYKQALGDYFSSRLRLLSSDSQLR